MNEAPATTDPFQGSHSRWRAVTHRIRAAHSSFLYGVKSTKIYCRPTCSARLARRANVVFYDSESQARRDGFRPCKRCKPDSATFLGEGQEVVTRVLELLRVPKDDLAVKRGLKELATRVGVTPSYLCRVFKKIMGITLGTYMKEFDSGPSDYGAGHTSQSTSDAGSDAVSSEKALSVPTATAWHPPAPGAVSNNWLVGKDHGDWDDRLDSDLNFDFNDWICNEEFWDSKNDAILDELFNEL